MGFRPAIVAMTIGAFAIAGCGGSGTLTQAELVRHVNAICKDRATQSAAIVTRVKDLATAQRQMLPTATKAVKDLSALKPPANLKTRYARFVADERTLVTNARLVLAGEEDKIREVGHDRTRLIRGLDFSACK